jgi:hypothetical protein
MGGTEMGNASTSAASAPSMTAASAAPVAAASTSAAPMAAASTTTFAASPTASATATTTPMSGKDRSRRTERHRDCAKAYGQAQDSKISVNQPHDESFP